MSSFGFNNPLFWPLTLIFVGVMIMMFNLGVIPASAWALWPIVLVVLGLVGLAGSSPTGVTRKVSKTSKKKKK